MLASIAGLASYQLGYSQAESSASGEFSDVYELSPFLIETDQDEGYRATATLAGTRVRTDMRDLASSISVVTKALLDDTGATSNESLLQYTTNTEVGGIFGNFSGVGNTQGINEGRNLAAPSTNTRVRGLDAADNTRNYFLSDIPWDGYIVDRVDLQRGPNSILFGVGSPAGIINTTTIIPAFENFGELQNRIGTYGSIRNSLKYNHVLIEDVLAVLVAGLSEDQKFRQKPAHEKDNRGFAAISYKPDWFGGKVVTNINANFEKGKIRANRPRILTPVDRITPWFTHMGQATYDPFWAWEYGAQVGRGNASKATLNPHVNNPWLGDDGGFGGDGVNFVYDNGNLEPSVVRVFDAQTEFAIGPDGSIDRGIDAYVYARMQGVAGFNEYSRNAEADALAKGLDNPFPAAASNFYKDIHLSNPGVFDFYNKLIDGKNKREWSDWNAYNLSLSQTFLRNRLGYELVYDYQSYKSGQYNLLGGSVALNVDLNSHLTTLPTEYPGVVPVAQGGGIPLPGTVQGGLLNPNVGRAYISGHRPRSNYSATIRENTRFTAFGEFKGSDLFEEGSFLARFIGRHVVTGLLSRDERRFDERQWLNFATSMDRAVQEGLPVQVDGYGRQVGFMVYMSDDLRGVSSPWNLNLASVGSVVDPRGTYSVDIFNSRWNAPNVDPSAPFTNPFKGDITTQSENVRNYVGMDKMDVGILNASAGDKDLLLTSSFKRTEVLDSVGLTWQGYFWDGLVVPTFGWRKDQLETWGASSPADPVDGRRTTDLKNEKKKGETLVKEGETISWGVVAHTDQILEDRMPLGTNLSVFYNRSKNFRADNRVGFSGVTLPSPSGASKDYGVVLNTLNDKLTFKVTWYTTEVKNTNFDGSSPLGDSTWFLHNIEAWGTALVLTNELYWNGELPGMGWRSNPGMVDAGMWGVEGWENAPFSEEARNHPANVEQFRAMEAWLATMPSQSFFDAYGLPIDTSKAQAGFEARRTMVDNGRWNVWGGIGSIQPAGGGRVNGINPTITIDRESKGVEFELQARPMQNWNITFNASKTQAIRKNLGSEITNWIQYQYNRFQGPAGDLRMWWGGDPTIRKYYNDLVYQAYLFQLDADGQSAAEIRPWRFNLISNYSFSDGSLRGLNIGAAYRWQDDSILGYELDDTKTKLDIKRPIHGGSEANIDAWIGYQHKLTDSIDWRVQLNLRNIGEDARLIPVSVNPDHTIAAGRIAEGMSWELTNTFSF
jgi:outer membrane receptor protein involved in Fe transport